MFFSVAFFSHGQRRALQLAFNITVYSSKYLVFLHISAMLKKVYGTINPYEIDPKLSSCKLFFSMSQLFLCCIQESISQKLHNQFCVVSRRQTPRSYTASSVQNLGDRLLEVTQLVLCSFQELISQKLYSQFCVVSRRQTPRS